MVHGGFSVCCLLLAVPCSLFPFPCFSGQLDTPQVVQALIASFLREDCIRITCGMDHAQNPDFSFCGPIENDIVPRRKCAHAGMFGRLQGPANKWKLCKQFKPARNGVDEARGDLGIPALAGNIKPDFVEVR